MIPNRALVVGSGKTAQSLLNFLNSQCELYLTDTRVADKNEVRSRQDSLERKFSNVKAVATNEVFAMDSTDLVAYLSPGIPLTDPFVQRLQTSGVRLSSDIELFLDNCTSPVLGVTGTNGKSTTTALLGYLLKSRGFKTGGNIGTPVLDIFDDLTAGYVLELSSFQLEKTPPLQLKAATILNITEDHTDHHGSFETYCRAKHRIYENCETAVFDVCAPETAPRAATHSIAVNQSDHWCVNVDGLTVNGVEIDGSSIRLTGRTNHLNAVIAAAMGSVCGLETNELVKGIQTFKGLPHRSEFIRELNGVQFVNDSKATNVAATIGALGNYQSEDRNILLIAGGMGKGACFDNLANPIAKQVKALFLMGRDATLLGKALEGTTLTSYVESLEEAVHRAFVLADEGDVVLMSPACASFDMFSDFEERGHCFRTCVEALS